MKSIKILFLFFITNLIFYDNAHAQIIKDSSRYYYKLAIQPSNNTDLTSAYEFYNNSKIKNLDKKNNLEAIRDLRIIAMIQMDLGDLSGSEVSSVDALKLISNLEENDSIINSNAIGVFNHFGRVYTQLEDYELAIDYYNELLEISEDSSDINIILNNRAFIFYKQKRYDLAINELSDIYKASVRLGDTIKIARALDNLGLSQSKLNISDALSNIQKGLALRKAKKSIDGIYTSYKHLVEYFKDHNDLEQAIFFSNKALRFADSVGKVNMRFNALENILRLSNDKNTLQFINLNDSITTDKLIKENKYAKIKFDYSEKEKDLQKSELIIEKQEKINLIYFFSGFLGLLSSIFLYVFLKSKHKKDKLQQVFNTESRISKKVHDEVANDVFQVMTKLQSTKSNKELIDDIEQIYKKTRDISKEHSVIDLEGSFEGILNDLILSYDNINTNVIAKGASNINWDAISELKRVTIYKVLQELLINMKKHSDAEIVVLTFEAKRKKILINYSDNGKGCNPNKGTGLQNVENRIASISGTTTFDSEINKGFKVKLTI